MQKKITDFVFSNVLPIHQTSSTHQLDGEAFDLIKFSYFLENFYTTSWVTKNNQNSYRDMLL